MLLIMGYCRSTYFTNRLKDNNPKHAFMKRFRANLKAVSFPSVATQGRHSAGKLLREPAIIRSRFQLVPAQKYSGSVIVLGKKVGGCVRVRLFAHTRCLGLHCAFGTERALMGTLMTTEALT